MRVPTGSETFHFHHRIQVRRPIETPNAQGGKDITYEILATVWTDPDPISNLGMLGTFIRDVQVGDMPTHVFPMRYSARLGITRKDLQKPLFLALVSYDNKEVREFEILSVVEVDERNSMIIVIAKERVYQYSTDNLV